MTGANASLARELGAEVARFALDHNRNPQSNGYKSYIRGNYQVLLTKHPEIAPFRDEFFKAAGVEQ